MKRWFWILIAVMSTLLATQPGSSSAQVDLLAVSWSAEYFNNPYLAGTPSISRQDNGIGFDWGFGSPGEGVPANNFSVRWGKGGYLPGGVYRFIITADEGFRLYIDGEVILDTWDEPQPGLTLGRDVELSTGEHQIQVDYREFDQTAYIYLDWGLAPAEAAAEALPVGMTATVSVDTLNVRREPRIANNLIGRISRGQVYPLLGRSEDGLWVELDLGSGGSGWVSSAYVTVGTEDSAASRLSGLTLRSNFRLFVRVSPGAEAEEVALLLPGEIVPIVGRNEDATWWKVQDGSVYGWVNALYITLSPDVDALDVTIVDE